MEIWKAKKIERKKVAIIRHLNFFTSFTSIWELFLGLDGQSEKPIHGPSGKNGESTSLGDVWGGRPGEEWSINAPKVISAV